jgi:hypothetical protein
MDNSQNVNKGKGIRTNRIAETTRRTEKKRAQRTTGSNE